MTRQLLLSVTIALLSAITLSAQIIQNGGFENLADCPDSFGIDTHIGGTMENWFTVQGTPDGYHMNCSAISPIEVVGIAQPALGDGLAGLFTNLEFIGHTFNEPLVKDSVYCMHFYSIHSTVTDLPPASDSLCTRVSIYGGNDLPVAEPDSWGGLVTVDEIPGTHLLGSSIANMDTQYWTLQSFDFQPDTTYNQMLIATWQDAACASPTSYICLDQMVIEACELVGVSEVETRNLEIYPNPSTTHVTVSGLPTGFWTAEVRKIDGRLVLSESMKNGTELSLAGLPSGIYLLAFPALSDVKPSRIVVE